MQSTRARVAVLVATVAAVVVLFIVLNGGGGGSSTTTETGTNGAGSVPTLVYENGEVQGGEQTLSYTDGDQIRIRVESDVETDAHLHGYDVELPVGPGKPANFDVNANLEGEFDLELHLPNGEVGLATIQVNPG